MDTLNKQLEIEARKLFISVSRLVLAWNPSVSSYSQFLRIKIISDRLLLRLRRRQLLLISCHEISFNPDLPNPYFHSPEKFRELSSAYYRSMLLYVYPGGFALSPALSSGVLGQGASL